MQKDKKMVTKTTKTEAPVEETAVLAKKPAALKVQVKKRDFADKVTEASGVKKADAKLVIDATLAELATALAAKSEVVVPPLGRLKVTREKDIKGGKVLLLRLQLDKGDAPAKAPKGKKQALAASED
jgi:hypothetical protein